ncbi:MAG TPA: aminotransferase class V-fold PLP-dependent enzyme [Acidimicrobiia bacterium]|nr:aminotransferase class V-fold PLP-dependent enzyme [Acidimicrobiia bacterium]
MNLKEHFSKFFEHDPDRLHFAAHSHHPWPDVTFEAHRQYWEDSAGLADDKWDHIFNHVLPETRQLVAGALSLPDPNTLTFAPNTHDFLVRIFSCLEPPVRILSTGSEFHSFARQSRRWEEAGLAIVDRIDTEPFDDFEERFLRNVAAGAHDLIYVSSVFYDSGYPVAGMADLVAAAPNDTTFFVIDGYHQFMARPIDLSTVADRALFVAGGYKYAMGGEGACFLHCPPGYGERPVDTGWYAGFGQLESGVGEDVPFASDGSRFAGATYDPSGVYRLRAVLGWLESSGIDAGAIHNHVLPLQEQFLDSEPGLGELVPGRESDRGNFLTFRNPDAMARYRSLHDRGVITDYRGNRLRIGFGIYHEPDDVTRLIDIVKSIT